MAEEIIFSVQESPEGGYEAKALSAPIFTEADNGDVATHSLHQLSRDRSEGFVAGHLDRKVIEIQKRDILEPENRRVQPASARCSTIISIGNHAGSLNNNHIHNPLTTKL